MANTLYSGAALEIQCTVRVRALSLKYLRLKLCLDVMKIGEMGTSGPPFIV
jgi:hypothetical protein